MHGVLSRDGYSPLQLVEDGRREVRAVDGKIHTGRVTELPAIEGLAEQWGRGVVACPYCDGYEARGSTIGVLAGSPMSLHVAQLLRAYSSNLTVFTALLGSVPADDLRALAARGIVVDHRPVNRVVTDGDVLTGLKLADGTMVALDVVFASGRMVPLDDLLRQLGAELTETPWGPWTASDPTGKTTVEGVWVAGNTANPAALVPVAAASGVTAALAINAELVAEDLRLAMAELEPVS